MIKTAWRYPEEKVSLLTRAFFPHDLALTDADTSQIAPGETAIYRPRKTFPIGGLIKVSLIHRPRNIACMRGSLHGPELII
jgi:hypothetical protein